MNSKPVCIVIGAGSTKAEVLAAITEARFNDVTIVIGDDVDLEQFTSLELSAIQPFLIRDIDMSDFYAVPFEPEHEKPRKFVKQHYKGNPKGQNKHTRSNYNSQNHRRR